MTCIFMVDDESELLRSFNESHVKHAVSQELGVVTPEVFNDSKKNRLLLYFSNPPIPIGGIIEHFSLWIDDELIDTSRINVNCAPKTTATLKLSKKTPLEIHQGGGLLLSINDAKSLLAEKGKGGTLDFKIYARIKGIGAFPFSYISFSSKIASIQKKQTAQLLKSLKRFAPIASTTAKKPSKPYVLSNGQCFLILDSESNDINAETLWGGVLHLTSGHFKAPAWGLRTLRTATIRDKHFSPKLLNNGKLVWTAPNTKEILIEHGIVSSTHQQPGGLTVQKQTFLPQPSKDMPTAIDAVMIHHTLVMPSQKSPLPKTKKKASYILEITPALLPYGNISAVLRDEIKASVEDKGKTLKFYSKKTGMEARLSSTLPFKAFTAAGARIAPGAPKILDEPKVYAAFDLSLTLAQPITIITAASIGKGVVLKQFMNANQYPSILNAVKTHYRNIFINSPSVSTPDPKLDEAYNKALIALDALKFDAEGVTGLVAGLPRFPNVWVRDAGESLEAVLMTNDSDFFRKSVEFICAKTPSRGEAPTVVSGKDYFHERLKYGSSDATLYVPILLKRHLEVCGDSEWLKKNYPKLKAMMSFVLDRREGMDLPVHDEYGTWMDHSPRAGTGIEIAALECEAFRSAAAIARALLVPGKDAERWEKEAERLKEIINTRFWNEKEKSFKDFLPQETKEHANKDDVTGSRRRPNLLVPILLGIADKDKADIELARIESASDGLLAPHGVRSLSSKDPAYSPYAYHDGSVWGLTTGWLAMAQFSRGRADAGFETVMVMAERILEENGMYAELYLGNSPKAHSSTVLQAFSVGTFVRAVIHHLFGIKVLANEKKVFLDPHFPSSWPRAQLNNVSVSTGNFIDLSFDNKARTITVYNRGKEEIEFVSADGNSMKVIGGNIAVLPIPKDYYKTEAPIV